MHRTRVRQKSGRHGESGYLLLVLMIAVAMLTITMLGVARNYRRSIQRDREVEMIHRGEQYARAVHRYYKKFGRYPTTIEQLENTNKIRFLRKRYKDPMSPDGEWKLAHITDIKFKNATGLATAAGASAGAGATASAGATQATSADAGGSDTSSAAGTANQSTANQNTGSILGGTSSTGTSTNTGLSQGTGVGGVAGASGVGNPVNQVLGGGALLGVVSKQKTEGIHSFGDKTKYNEWFFIYDPSQDKGQLLVGPYNPNMFVGSANSGLGNKTTSGTGTGSTPSTGTVGTGTSTSSPTTTPTSTPTTTP